MATSTSLNLRALAEDRRHPQRHGYACARGLGPDAAGQGAVRGGGGSRAAERRRAVRRARRRRPRRGRAPTSRSSWRRSKGSRRPRSSARCCRFPRTKSTRIAAWRRISASRPRARARLRHRARQRPRRRCVSGGAPAARHDARAAGRRVARAEAGTGHLADRSRRSCSSTRGSRARIRRTSTASLPSAAASLDVFPGRRPASGPPRVHRRHDRDAAHLRPGDAALDRADRSGRRSSRCATSWTAIDGATMFDYLPRGSESRIIVSERDEVEAHATKVLRAAAAELSRTVAERQSASGADAASARAPDDLLVATGIDRLGAARAGDDALIRRRSTKAGARSDASRRWNCAAASPTGSPRSAGCATTAKPSLFVAGTPGRAERTIELLKEYDVFAIPVERAEDARYAAVLVASAPVARLPPARTPAFRYTPRPMSSKRSGGRPSGGAPRPRRFSRTCAT